MTGDLDLKLRDDAPVDVPRHYFVKGSPEMPGFRGRDVADRCARARCGMHAAHPVHLRPAGPDFGDAPIAASG